MAKKYGRYPCNYDNDCDALFPLGFGLTYSKNDKKTPYHCSIVLLFCTEIHAQSWTLLWEDEFNSTTLDSNYWSHDIGSGSQFNLYGWGNSELQYYQPQNTSISNGILTIEARVEPTPIYDSWNVPYNYSSSKIVTRNISLSLSMVK